MGKLVTRAVYAWFCGVPVWEIVPLVVNVRAKNCWVVSLVTATDGARVPLTILGAKVVLPAVAAVGAGVVPLAAAGAAVGTAPNNDGAFVPFTAIGATVVPLDGAAGATVVPFKATGAADIDPFRGTGAADVVPFIITGAAEIVPFIDTGADGEVPFSAVGVDVPLTAAPKGAAVPLVILAGALVIVVPLTPLGAAVLVPLTTVGVDDVALAEAGAAVGTEPGLVAPPGTGVFTFAGATVVPLASDGGAKVPFGNDGANVPFADAGARGAIVVPAGATTGDFVVVNPDGDFVVFGSGA